MILARRLRHQAAHPGELTHLLRRAARTRVGHHEDGVEARDVLLFAVLVAHDVGAEAAEHLVRDLLGRLRPDVDHPCL